MTGQKKITEKTISMLLAGKSKIAKKFAGKHVLVVKNKVVPMKEDYESFWNDMEKLEKTYKEKPISVFVPRHDVSYILLLCK